MARSLVNTIQSPIVSPSLLAGGSFGGEGSTGAWVGYRDSFASPQAATLHISAALDGGIAVQDPATDLTATAATAGNAGNNIFFDFDDSGGGGVQIATSTSTNGDRRIAVTHDGAQTNGAVVSAIQGNGTANGWVTVSTSNSGGAFYPQPGPTYDITVGGRNFYLKAGCDANTPRTGTGASANAVTIGTYLSNALPPQASGNGFIISSITQSNQGISIPFVMPQVSQLTLQSIRIKFKWSAARNLSGGASNGTVFKCYLIDSDNTFQIPLGPLTDIAVGNQGTNSGFVNVVVPGGNVLGSGAVAPRSWSQNYRLAIHSVDTNFALVIALDDIQISLDHGEVQELRDLRVFNPVINSGFEVWQRGQSFTTPSSNTYTADRWVHEYDGTIGTFSISRQAFTVGQTNVPDEPQFYLQWNHTVAGSGSTFRRISHRLEGVRQFAGKTVTVSFWAMSATNFISGGCKLIQNFGAGGSGAVTTASQGFSFNNGQWFKHSFTFQVPSISGKTIGASDYLAIVIDMPVNTVFQANIAQVMMAEGGATSQYRRTGTHLAHEVALCQRYYEKSLDLDVVPGTASAPGEMEFRAAQSANLAVSVQFKVTKRATPTVTAYDPTGGTGTWRDTTNTVSRSTSAQAIGVNSALMIVTAAVAGGNMDGHWAADAEIF